MMKCEFKSHGDYCCIEAAPYYIDPDINDFLAEEAMGVIVSLSRHILGQSFSPKRIELTSSNTEALETCQKYFKCPVFLRSSKNRILISNRWLEEKIPGYDRASSLIVREQLCATMRLPEPQSGLVMTLRTKMLDEPGIKTSQKEMARMVNISERTLRRRLGEQDTNYSNIRDRVLLEKSTQLLLNSSMTVKEISEKLGYSDTRNFRKAFKRWTGTQPGFLRKKQSTLPE